MPEKAEDHIEQGAYVEGKTASYVDQITPNGQSASKVKVA